jgi:hypothetical protein
MAAHIGEVGGDLPGRRRVVVVGDAEGRAVVAQDVEDGGLVPTGVAKLDGGPAPLGKPRQKPGSRSSSRWSMGGNWTRAGPRLSPSGVMRPNTRSTLSWQSLSFLLWVMKRDTFQANRKPSGTWSAQAATAFSVGRR